jgi:hypothetical protein
MLDAFLVMRYAIVWVFFQPALCSSLEGVVFAIVFPLQWEDQSLCWQLQPLGSMRFREPTCDDPRFAVQIHVGEVIHGPHLILTGPTVTRGNAISSKHSCDGLGLHLCELGVLRGRRFEDHLAAQR